MNKTILLILLGSTLCFTVQAQTVVYTYNLQGGCTSRIIEETSPKIKKASKTSKKLKLLKVEISPSAAFQDLLSISVTELPFGRCLSYIMTDISGRAVSSGTLGNGNTTIRTTDLPRGFYIIKISGEDFKKAYKMFKY